MKNKYFKFNKKRANFSVFLGILITFFLISCEEDETNLGIDHEPSAAVGFLNTDTEATEGGAAGVLEIIATKNVFNDVSFDIVVLEGDGSEVTITDSDGNSGTSFKISKGTKQTNLSFVISNNSDFTGDREVKYGLTNLVGDGVFLAEEEIGSGSDKVYAEFALSVLDDEQAPPTVSFDVASASISENANTMHTITLQFAEPTPYAGTFDLALSGTAVAGDDFTSDAVAGIIPISFGVGVEEIIVNIMPVDDAVAETDKTVILTMTNLGTDILSGAITEYTLTITEDDLPTVELIAEADGIIRAGSGSGDIIGGGIGSSTQMSSGSDPLDNGDKNNRHSLSRWDISGVDLSKVISAKLVFTATDDWTDAETNAGGTTTQNIHHITGDDSWDETVLTWDNAPVFDATPFVTGTFAAVGAAPAPPSATIHEYDVTDTLKNDSDGKFSIRMTVSADTSGKRIRYSSKDTGTPENLPKLIIVSTL
ncbi:DNRLRE domain-containing protein [Flavivirga spongiicola]|uniref:DNRLRE domain-containing protein n=1 Tax=Flavivirga spongiicola TaxID=421621 RepID=A0ABU7XW75_9FLAO|nr:DNRLRE domain-containing protein [Flavivirga sp. MEBiC05379]MDO5980039.1 DNRLRE domain-containing protein [Flavivirga sp. MEBiC05379]